MKIAFGTDQGTGTVADLVAVPGDPLADIKLVMKPSFVMKGGTIYKQ